MATDRLSEWTDTLCGVSERAFRHLSSTFGSSHSASSAYQKWPTKNSSIRFSFLFFWYPGSMIFLFFFFCFFFSPIKGKKKKRGGVFSFLF